MRTMAESKISYVMAHYKAPLMLERHFQEWAQYPDDVKNRLRVVIVDDGSPEPARVKDVPGLEIRLYRIHENTPWNQDGARNLAMSQSPDEIAFMTDMDHLLTPENAERLVFSNWQQGTFYMPRRHDINGAECNRHPNSFVLSVKDFWAIGGYDEDFCGYYGSDGNFRKRLHTVARESHTNQFALVQYNNDLVPDASTREWGRKDSEYYAKNSAYLKSKKLPYVATNPLRFTWSRIQ